MQGIVKKDRYEAWLAYNVPIWRLILYSWKCATTKCMDPIHVVDVMDPVLVTMNCMLVRKLRGMYHIIRKFPSTPNGWVGTRNRSWTLQKVFQSAEKRLPPSHHPVIDCTDSYWTNLAGLERFTLLNCFFAFCVCFPPKTLSIHVFLPPQKDSPNPRDSRVLLGLQSWPEEQAPMQVSMSESYHELPKTWIFKSKIRKKNTNI